MPVCFEPVLQFVFSEPPATAPAADAATDECDGYAGSAAGIDSSSYPTGAHAASTGDYDLGNFCPVTIVTILLATAVSPIRLSFMIWYMFTTRLTLAPVPLVLFMSDV